MLWRLGEKSIMPRATEVFGLGAAQPEAVTTGCESRKAACVKVLARPGAGRLSRPRRLKAKQVGRAPVRRRRRRQWADGRDGRGREPGESLGSTKSSSSEGSPIDRPEMWKALQLLPFPMPERPIMVMEGVKLSSGGTQGRQWSRRFASIRVDSRRFACST